VAIPSCNILCGVNNPRKEAGIISDSDDPFLFIQSDGKFQLNYICVCRHDINIFTVELLGQEP